MMDNLMEQDTKGVVRVPCFVVTTVQRTIDIVIPGNDDADHDERSTVPCTWADGMVGVFPVFSSALSALLYMRSHNIPEDLFLHGYIEIPLEEVQGKAADRG